MNKYIKESSVTILDVLTMVFLKLFPLSASLSLTAEVSAIIPPSQLGAERGLTKEKQGQ